MVHPVSRIEETIFQFVVDKICNTLLVVVAAMAQRRHAFAQFPLTLSPVLSKRLCCFIVCRARLLAMSSPCTSIYIWNHWPFGSLGWKWVESGHLVMKYAKSLCLSLAIIVLAIRYDDSACCVAMLDVWSPHWPAQLFIKRVPVPIINSTNRLASILAFVRWDFLTFHVDARTATTADRKGRNKLWAANGILSNF